MKTKTWAIAITILCTLFTSLGQIFFKWGSENIAFSLQGLILNTPLIIGLMVYGIGAVLYLLALRHGELSVIAPLIATSYIWVSIISPYFFPSDVMNPIKWVGVATIFLGVSLIGYGGRL